MPSGRAMEQPGGQIEEFPFLRAARFVRCADEGELVFGLTKHGATLSTPEFVVKRQFLPILSADGSLKIGPITVSFGPIS
jgi:hypothetical protein